MALGAKQKKVVKNLKAKGQADLAKQYKQAVLSGEGKEARKAIRAQAAPAKAAEPAASPSGGYDPGGYDYSTPEGAIGSAIGAADHAVKTQQDVNRYDVYNPLGSQVVSIDPETGRQRVDQTLNETNQSLLEGRQGLDQQILGQAGQSLSGMSNDFSKDRQGMIDSLYSDFNRRIDESADRNMESFRRRMYDQGVMPGTERYNIELQGITDQVNRAKQDALTSATQMAGSEQARMFDMGQTQYRNLMGTFEGAQIPQFDAPAQINVPTPDVGGIAASMFKTQQDAITAGKQIAAEIKLGKLSAETQRAVAGMQSRAAGGDTSARMAIAQMEYDLGSKRIESDERIADTRYGSDNSSASKYGPIAGAAAGGILGGIGDGIGDLISGKYK